MAIITSGRVAVKTRGRNAGEKCIIVGGIKDKKVETVGKSGKQKISINHLEPTPHIVEADSKLTPEKAAKMLDGLGQ